jgi:formate--tetrahydrofolate ligase
VKKDDLNREDIEAVRKGCANLGRHVQNVKKFGVPVVVAINHFTSDTEAEIRAVRDYVATLGAEAILCRHWAEGSAGIEALARKVVELADSGLSQFSPLYPDDMPLFQKIETIAKDIYHAGEVIADKTVRDQLRVWEEQGYGRLPVCMAKTQYSFSTDPNLRGAPSGHTVPVREVRLSAGAGFVVVITGEIMTMPGLPKVPSSERIFLNEDGQIEGLS